MQTEIKWYLIQWGRWARQTGNGKMSLSRPGAQAQPEITDLLAEMIDRSIARLGQRCREDARDHRYKALLGCYMHELTDARVAERLRVSRPTAAQARKAGESWVECALFDDIDPAELIR